MTEPKEQGGNYYIIIPAPVKTSKILSPQAKLLFGEIAIKCNARGYCWATNQYFSEVFDCNIRSIQRYIKELEDANFVAIELIEDPEKGLIRKIYATVLSQHPATVLSPIGTTDLSRGDMTDLSSPPVTAVSPPHDSAVVPPHDNPVVENNKNSVLIKENSKKENINNDAPPDSGAAQNLFGEKDSKKEKKKKQPQETAPPGLYKDFVDIYFKWFKEINGVPPKMDAANGSAAKHLISYFRTLVEDKASDKKEILDEMAKDSKILEGWNHLLKNWKKLDNYSQNKTRLLDINANIQNLITQIKNGNGTINGNHSGKNGQSTPGATFQQFATSLSAKFSGRENNGHQAGSI